VAIAAVIDKGGLQRRLDSRHLRQIDVAFDLFLGGRLEIEFFETGAAGNNYPSLLGVGGVDKHALCHSGRTPRRAAAAVLKTAGDAVLCGRKLCVGKPGVFDIIASRDFFFGVASTNTLGFG
jgi:hypothetical protein